MPLEISFSRPVFKPVFKLNHLRSGVGLFRSETHKRGMVSTLCGSKKQTADHIITFCSIYHHKNGARALSDVKKKLVTWLMEHVRPFSRPSSSCQSSQTKKNFSY